MHKRDFFFTINFSKEQKKEFSNFMVGEIRLVTTGLGRASLSCETLGTIEGGFNVTLKTSGAPLYQSFPFLDNCFCLSGLAARSFAVSLRFWHRFLPFLLSSKPPYLLKRPPLLSASTRELFLSSYLTSFTLPLSFSLSVSLPDFLSFALLCPLSLPLSGNNFTYRLH